MVALVPISETLRIEVQSYTRFGDFQFKPPRVSYIDRSFRLRDGSTLGFCGFRHRWPCMLSLIQPGFETSLFRFSLLNLNIAVSLAASHLLLSHVMSRPADLDRSEAFPCSPEPIKYGQSPRRLFELPAFQCHLSGYLQELYLLVAEYDGESFGFSRILEIVDVITLTCQFSQSRACKRPFFHALVPR